MGIRIVCPSCREVYTVDDALRGKRVMCRGCREPIPVRAAAPRARQEEDEDSDERRRPERRIADQPSRRNATRARTDDDDRPRRRSAGRDRDEDERDVKKNGNMMPLLLVGGGVGGLLFGALVVVGLVFAFKSPSKLPDPPPGPVVTNVADRGTQPPPRVEPPPGQAPATMDASNLSRVKRSTVMIKADLPTGGQSQGTGFFAIEPGIVVTNAHVLGMLAATSQAPRTVAIIAHSGQSDEFTMTGTILAVDRVNDLAVLRAATPNPSRMPPPLAVDSASRLTETQELYVFGFPYSNQLGKDITVTRSSVTSLRRNGVGMLDKIQVNGGMNPGNSGGPVTDTRGVVVGVSVAKIVNSEISFAIPGDYVKRILDGRVSRSELGTPYLASGQTHLPVRLAVLDPLKRLRNVKVEVWTGNPGNERPESSEQPEEVRGDSPPQTFPASAKDNAYHVDVALPSLEPGKVYWVRPTFVDGNSVPQWGSAVPVPFESQVAVERKDALLAFKAPTSRIERTLKMKSKVTVTAFQGKAEAGWQKQELESDILESLSPATKGTGILLTLGRTQFVQTDSRGGLGQADPTALASLSKFPATFLLDSFGKCSQRGIRNFNSLPVNQRKSVEGMFEAVCNTFEATSMPLPNRTLKPTETWSTRLPMFVLARGKRTIQDMFLTCTYEGLRSVNGRNEARIGLAGEVKSRAARGTFRGPRGSAGTAASPPAVLGKVKGHAYFDVDAGFLSLVSVTVNSEVDLETTEGNVRVMVSDESTLTRVEGNQLGISPASLNPPAGATAGKQPKNPQPRTGTMPRQGNPRMPRNTRPPKR